MPPAAPTVVLGERDATPRGVGTADTSKLTPGSGRLYAQLREYDRISAVVRQKLVYFGGRRFYTGKELVVLKYVVSL